MLDSSSKQYQQVGEYWDRSPAWHKLDLCGRKNPYNYKSGRGNPHAGRSSTCPGHVPAVGWVYARDSAFSTFLVKKEFVPFLFIFRFPFSFLLGKKNRNHTTVKYYNKILISILFFFKNSEWSYDYQSCKLFK